MMNEISWTNEKVSKIWKFYSEKKSYYKDNFSYGAGENVIEWVDKFINFKKINTAIDFGCGPGFLIGYLLKKYKHIKVSGCDIDNKFINDVNNKYNIYNNFYKAYNAKDLDNICYNDYYDIVFLIEVIEHLDDNNLNKVINDIHKILKVGGFLVITTPNKEDLLAGKVLCPECNCVFHVKQHVRSWDKLSLVNFLDSKGIVPIKVDERVFLTKEKSLLFDLLKKLYWNYKKAIGMQMPHLAFIGQKLITNITE